MDELVAAFIDNFYSDELKQEILRSLDLIEKFESDNIYDTLINLINQSETLSTEDICDYFVTELVNKLNFILREHKIITNPDTPIQKLNEILNALYLIQNLEDYTGIIRLLESFESDTEILVQILSELCVLSESEILECIYDFDAIILKNLKQFIYSKEKEPIEINDQNFINNIKTFFELFKINTVGQVLIKSGIKLNFSIKFYLQYLSKDILIGDNENIALNILSVLMITSEGQKDPVNVYRKISFHLFQNLNTTSIIEVELIKLLNKYNEYKNAKDSVATKD